MGFLLQDDGGVLGKRPLQSWLLDGDDERGEAGANPPPLCQACTTEDAPTSVKRQDLTSLNGNDRLGDDNVAVTLTPDDYAQLIQVCPTTEDVLEQEELEATAVPTPDDYANLLFCDLFEEEETRATLARAAAEQCHDGGTSQLRSSRIRHRRKKHRKHVSFGAAVPIHHLLSDVPPASAMTPAERSAGWFGKADLAALKAVARRAIQDLRRRVATEGAAARGAGLAGFRALMAEAEDATGSSVRGLEHRAGRRREARRAAVRDVLACQAHAAGLASFGHALGAEERAGLLARVSAARSRRARAVAMANARHDWEEARLAEDAAVLEARARKRQKRALTSVSL